MVYNNYVTYIVPKSTETPRDAANLISLRINQK